MFRSRLRFALTTVVGSLLLMALFQSVHAQQEYVLRFEGRVIWISGQTMFLAPDGAPGFTIDVTRINQSDLRELTPNDYVLVTGVMLRPGRRIAATSIQRISAWYPQAP